MGGDVGGFSHDNRDIFCGISSGSRVEGECSLFEGAMKSLFDAQVSCQSF